MLIYWELLLWWEWSVGSRGVQRNCHFSLHLHWYHLICLKYFSLITVWLKNKNTYKKFTIIFFLFHSLLIKFSGRMWTERKQSGLLTSVSHTWVPVFDYLWFPSCALTVSIFRYAFMVRNSILFCLNFWTKDLRKKLCFCNTCLV